jgi:hypothetical protein
MNSVSATRNPLKRVHAALINVFQHVLHISPCMNSRAKGIMRWHFQLCTLLTYTQFKLGTTVLSLWSRSTWNAPKPREQSSWKLAASRKIKAEKLLISNCMQFRTSYYVSGVIQVGGSPTFPERARSLPGQGNRSRPFRECTRDADRRNPAPTLKCTPTFHAD